MKSTFVTLNRERDDIAVRLPHENNRLLDQRDEVYKVTKTDFVKRRIREGALVETDKDGKPLPPPKPPAEQDQTEETGEPEAARADKKAKPGAKPKTTD